MVDGMRSSLGLRAMCTAAVVGRVGVEDWKKQSGMTRDFYSALLITRGSNVDCTRNNNLASASSKHTTDTTIKTNHIHTKFKFIEWIKR